MSKAITYGRPWDAVLVGDEYITNGEADQVACITAGPTAPPTSASAHV